MNAKCRHHRANSKNDAATEDDGGAGAVERELRNHPDKAWVSWLLHSGISIGYKGPTPYTARNLSSALQHPKVITSKLQKEVATGRDLVPSQTRDPDLSSYHCHVPRHPDLSSYHTTAMLPDTLISPNTTAMFPVVPRSTLLATRPYSVPAGQPTQSVSPTHPVQRTHSKSKRVSRG
jgi:hypothetical protein